MSGLWLSDSIWMDEQMTQVQIAVSATVACYFKRRKLIPQQVIEQTRPDGSLVVGASISHSNQILPFVRYWIPHVRILQPVHWQQSMDDSLQSYLACS